MACMVPNMKRRPRSSAIIAPYAIDAINWNLIEMETSEMYSVVSPRRADGSALQGWSLSVDGDGVAVSRQGIS